MNNQQLLALHVVDHLMGSSNDFHADPRSQTNVLLEKEKMCSIFTDIGMRMTNYHQLKWQDQFLEDLHL